MMRDKVSTIRRSVGVAITIPVGRRAIASRRYRRLLRFPTRAFRLAIFLGPGPFERGSPCTIRLYPTGFSRYSPRLTFSKYPAAVALVSAFLGTRGIGNAAI